MYSVKRSRMLKIAALAGLSTLALALPGAAHAVSSATVSNAGPGSTVIVDGDAAPNQFMVTKVAKQFKIQDQKGGAIATSQFCARPAGAPASVVQCKPYKGSSKIVAVNLNYNGGDDIAPALTSVGNIDITIDGGEGKDNLSGTQIKGTRFYGGAGNDVINGGPYGDLAFGGDPVNLIDPFGIDIVWGNGGTDAIFLKDFVGGDLAICQGGVGTVFADWNIAGKKDATLYCGNVL